MAPITRSAPSESNEGREGVREERERGGERMEIT